MHPVYFLGRFHVLILHLPIALVLIVAAMEWLTRRGRHPEFAPALRLLWGATALTAILTVALGYMHFSEGGFTGRSAFAHRALGTGVAIVATLAWLLQSRAHAAFERVRAALAVALIVLITLTGHFGGNLTHGDTYLVEFAPDSIRRLAGLEVARAPVAKVGDADPYLDVVRPIFAARCFSCHNADKRRGGLNLATLADVMKGGKDGAVIVAGSSKDSDLFRRISLPADARDVMPAEGKTPLTPEQAAIIGWWIDGGAKSGTTLAALNVPPATTALITAQLGLAGGSEAQHADGDTVKAADPQLIAALNEAGFMARQVSRSDPHLIVSPLAPGTRLSAAQIDTLASRASAEVVELDIQHTGLDDEAIRSVSKLTQLTHLRLDRNSLTDKAIATVAQLKKLEFLSVFGNKGVSDASVGPLAHFDSLREVYLWDTAVSKRGLEQLNQQAPKLRANAGEIEVPVERSLPGANPS